MQSTDLTKALHLLQSGNVVAIPTETVYGLAADITQPKAVEKIYSLKQRPLNHPLIVHIASIEDLSRYAQDIPDYVFTLAAALWPGPLTFVLPKTNLVDPMLTGGQDYVALRMPAHPITLQLIKMLGHPVAAPSANRFGKVSPTTPQHVYDEFGDAVPYILDGGRCEVGIESTIIDATHLHQSVILRQGILTASDLNKVLGRNLVQSTGEPTTLRVSGNLASHYSPSHPLFLGHNAEELREICQSYPNKVYVLSMQQYLDLPTPFQFVMPNDPLQYAYQLYFQLRIADQSNTEVIAVELPPDTEAWQGIQDKLKRAAVR